MPKTAKEKRTSRQSPNERKNGRGKASSPEGSQPKARKSASNTSLKSNSEKKNGNRRPEEEQRPPNYLLHCALVSSEDPMITRLLSVPSNATFETMHEVMQVAFGWANSHMWSFDVMKIQSEDEVEAEIQAETYSAMPLLTFQPDPEDMASIMSDRADKYKDASAWKLSDVFEDDQYRDKVNLMYEYDMGDSWEHQITFLGVENPGARKAMMAEADYSKVICLAGEGHPCAEDCGAAPGWEHLKQVFAKPRSRDPDGLKEWYKTQCLNGDPKGLDPYAWNILDVNDDLYEIEV